MKMGNRRKAALTGNASSNISGAPKNHRRSGYNRSAVFISALSAAQSGSDFKVQGSIVHPSSVAEISSRLRIFEASSASQGPVKNRATTEGGRFLFIWRLSFCRHFFDNCISIVLVI